MSSSAAKIETNGETILGDTSLCMTVTVPGLGRVLDINILGSNKICAFDCAYCDRGASTVRLNRLKKDIVFPNAGQVADELTTALRELGLRGLINGNEVLKALRLYGNGDPALHPEFVDIVNAILGARSPWGTNVPFEIYTSGANLDSRKILEAMNKADERILKIDSGTEKLFKSLNSPLSRTTLAKIIDGARGLKDHIMHSVFVRGMIDNTAQTDLEDWIEVVGIMRPKLVRIATAGPVTTLNGVQPCDEDTLYTIASKLERKTQIKSQVIF